MDSCAPLGFRFKPYLSTWINFFGQFNLQFEMNIIHQAWPPNQLLMKTTTEFGKLWLQFLQQVNQSLSRAYINWTNLNQNSCFQVKWSFHNVSAFIQSIVGNRGAAGICFEIDGKSLILEILLDWRSQGEGWKLLPGLLQPSFFSEKNLSFFAEMIWNITIFLA